MFDNSDLLVSPGRCTLSGAPEGYDALVLAGLARRGEGPPLLHVARDDARLQRLAEAASFFAPDVEVRRFPAWDCLPYDRVSPNAEIAAERADVLSRLAADAAPPPLLLTTVNALTQRVPPRRAFRDAVFSAAAGEDVDVEALTGFLARNGYHRAGAVREAGEYAMRGGILDVFPPGQERPLRLDLLGDTLERIRVFDPGTQRTSGSRDRLTLKPAGEIWLDEASVARFRSGYRELFGAVSGDPLYAAVSEGRKQIGMEHWLPLFHAGLDTLFDYAPDAAVTLDHGADAMRDARLETIADYYDARRTFLEARGGRGRQADDDAPAYRPLPQEMLYLDAAEWDRRLAARPVGEFSPFAAPPEARRRGAVVDLGGRRSYDFAAARAKARAGTAEPPDANVFDQFRERVVTEARQGRRVVVAAFTPGSRERLRQLLADHAVRGLAPAEGWAAALALPADAVALVVLGLDHGFTTRDTALFGEQDILGERLVRSRRRRPADFVADAGSLSAGDLVVHVDHGIGRFEGLETVVVGNAPHDCLRLTYAGEDRLYLPVENVEALSRYGSEEAGAALDRLGGAGWQARKARLKKRLRDMADQLIQVAASRALTPARAIAPAAGVYDEFCARFPYAETEDQEQAIAETMDDLGSGRPMDRLICGDVGFGKTEVALRAAVNAVMAGGQVAVIAPTTLLCRQHFATFRDRFADLPVRIEQLSRLVATARATEVKARLADGSVDIVIGTHALLAKGVAFRNLSLLVVDEEQHFGVAHKERLKRLKADVHVLTLTATPIPRTLQMALSGVRDMSTIATPPIDRLAVRTFVTPYDPVVVREAIMRERFRGGQIFYVCPRIEHLEPVAERLAALTPEVKLGVAHGRMPKRALEDVMTAFYDQKIDLLLSTQIIESGLDIPTANTLVVHRADMLGLSQLYQLRGRVGRSRLRAYCYLTLPPGRILTPAAEKRLEVMQTLDTLGAGFTLASHDLDIRGAGNLLGDEQSGHIREIGVELYQRMLEDAVAEARGRPPKADDGWTPQINLGAAVLIPDGYVADLDARLGLYRRIAGLEAQGEIDAFAAELIDRFGPLPTAVENLLRIVAIKRLCRAAGVEKLEAGPKGATVSFRDDAIADPAGLVRLIEKEAGRARLRPDHKLVWRRDWRDAQSRLAGAQRLIRELAEIGAPPGR